MEHHLVDRAAILADVLSRQHLRREAKLPLLDVRREYERIVEQALWREHVAQHYEVTSATVLRNLRARHGSNFPQSAGGRWALDALVTKALRESFRAGRST